MGVNADGIEELTPEKLATARRFIELHRPLEYSLPEVCAYCLRSWGEVGCTDLRWANYMIARSHNERIARAFGSGHAHA